MILDTYERHEAAFLAWRASTRCIAVGADMEVSDHALIRWLERAHGIEMEAFREILADKVRDAAEAGATSIKVDGLVFVLKAGVLVTVTPSKPKHLHSRRCRRDRGR